MQESRHSNTLSNTSRVTENKSLCILPWIHLHVMPSADVLPCCLAPVNLDFGSLRNNSLKNIWNNEGFRQLRLRMIRGQKSPSCTQCYDIEKSGGQSRRLHMNQLFSSHMNVVKETTVDGSIEDPKMRFLDIRFSNVCNFKCLGCSPHFSTSWGADRVDLNKNGEEMPRLLDIEKIAPSSFDEIRNMLPDVEFAYFAGGEPLLSLAHYKCLSELLTLGKTDIPIEYSTNLSVLSFRNFNVLNLWKKFKDINVMISIDDIEKKGEYFRFGQNWGQTMQNISVLIKECPHVKIQINCTVNALNISRLPEIHRYLFKRGLVCPYSFHLIFLFHPDWLATKILNSSAKKKVSRKLHQYISELKTNHPSADWSYLKKSFQAQINQLTQKSDKSNQLAFYTNMAILDKKRGNSLKAAYPEAIPSIKEPIWTWEKFCTIRSQLMTKLFRRRKKQLI